MSHTPLLSSIEPPSTVSRQSPVSLHQRLAERVQRWREQGYAHDEYPTVGEILRWVAAPDDRIFRLRPPQIAALETYWYLRLVEDTPQILMLYQRCFPDESELLAALGVTGKAWSEAGASLVGLIERVLEDDDFARRYKMAALRETLSLAYPSYILALAMGAGKTILIGSIVASEFAMSLAHPSGSFVQNALVFAPGRTIIESLRELVAIDYASILPPHLHNRFAAMCKFTITQDGAREVNVLSGSTLNVIVTNTEKIRIQKEKVRKSQLGALATAEQSDAARAEVANLRLQSIASLPNLAIFSDEAHHTYGQALGAGLKKVRKTVDYTADQTNLICVVNTTGTPYFKRQPLRDVVIWYGLSAGIRDGILKEVAGNILSYEIHNLSTKIDTKPYCENTLGARFSGTCSVQNDGVGVYLTHVVQDFFGDYRDVVLPDGTPAKLAIFFPRTEDVQRWRSTIETALAGIGLSPALILEHHTRHENKVDFDRFKLRESLHRVALLVDRGVEGWDVPALFGCVLARQLKNSNNFVLQAACRCLRQVSGNETPARIYLSEENRAILNRQLAETYGESLADLDRARRGRSRPKPVSRVRAMMRPPPPAQIGDQRYAIRSRLSRPADLPAPTLQRRSLALDGASNGGTTAIKVSDRFVDLYAATVELAALYRLPLWDVWDELRRLYPGSGQIPYHHIPALRRQIEQTPE